MLSRWQSTIVDEQGNVQPLANLTVRLESDQSLAKMWASPGTTQPLPDGMVQADGNGYAFFYARGGLYRITSVALGIDWRAVQIGAALVSIGDYAAGLEITARNQIFWKDGELYRAGAVLELPYTTTGDWGEEESLFVSVGDRALRQELASGVGPGYGALRVGYRGRTVAARLDDVVNVLDYGAVGDNVTADTQAFTDALAVAISENKPLIIPEIGASYKLAAGQINFIAANLSILGWGKPSIEFVGSGNGLTLDTGGLGAFVENMTVENLTIVGGPDIDYGFFSRGVVRSVFRNIEVREAGNSAFRIAFAVSCTFDNLKYTCGTHTTKALHGLYLTNDGIDQYYCADNTFINPIMEDNPDGYGCVIHSGSGNMFHGGTFEGLTNGVSIEAGCRRNVFNGLWMEANSNYDAADAGELTVFNDCHFGSGSSLLNLQVSTGQGCTVRGGYLRAATVQTSSKDTLFLGVGFDQNTGGGLGIQGQGTYQAFRCLKIDDTGNVVGAMTDLLGAFGGFAPTLEGSSGGSAHTYTQQSGHYTIIGNTVYYQIWIVIGTKDATMEGVIQVVGLPSRSAANVGFATALVNFGGIALTSGRTTVSGHIGPNSAVIIPVECGPAIGSGSINASQISDGSELMISGSYFID